MSSFDEGYEKTILEAAVGRAPEAERWVTLCTTAPTKAAKGTAAAYTGYKDAKVLHTSWNAAVGGSPSSITNSAAITFPECTGGESKVGWFEIYEEEAKTVRVAWGALTAEKTVITGNTPSFAAEALKLTQE